MASPNEQPFLSIQYLRAFAALTVVWFHACQQLDKIIDVQTLGLFDGRSGVDVFFVISGFIMWITTYGRQISPLEFWRRRVIRIVPLYWLCSVGLVVLLALAPGLFGRSHLDLSHVIQSLLFIPHIDPFQPDTAYQFPLLQVGWTLNFEMFFYFAFGLCLLLQPRQRLCAIIALFGGLIAMGLIVQPTSSNALLLNYTNPLLLEFIAGLLIGSAYTAGWRPRAVLSCGLISVAIVSFIGMPHLLEVNVVEWRVLLWGLPAALFITGSVGIERAVRLPDVAIMRRLGDASYAIYLSHLFSLGAICWVLNKVMDGVMMPSWILVGAAVVISVGCGFVVHHHIELPMARRLQRWCEKPRWAQPTIPALQCGAFSG